MKKIITIDTTNKKYPNFINKETTPGNKNGWIKCDIEIEKDEIRSGIILSISSNGKYMVKLNEK